MSNLPKSSLRLVAGKEMTLFIRSIIYNKDLDWGAQVLGLAYLDTPFESSITNAKMAKKIHTSESQISIWRKQLARARLAPRMSLQERRLAEKNNTG